MAGFPPRPLPPPPSRHGQVAEACGGVGGGAPPRRRPGLAAGGGGEGGGWVSFATPRGAFALWGSLLPRRPALGVLCRPLDGSSHAAGVKQNPRAPGLEERPPSLLPSKEGGRALCVARDIWPRGARGGSARWGPLQCSWAAWVFDASSPPDLPLRGRRLGGLGRLITQGPPPLAPGPSTTRTSTLGSARGHPRPYY